MSDTPPNTPQFSTAEYVEQASGDRCNTCEQPLAEEYYRVSGAITCTSCAKSAAGRQPNDSHAAFVRAIVFGIGGAVIGLILYSTIGIVTGLQIGYVSLAVGWLVGRGMMMGSGGIGGRRYQIAAFLLTYASVSLSAIPIFIAQSAKQQGASQSQPAGSPNAPEPSGKTGEGGSAQTSQEPKIGLAAALGFLLLLGLAAPFLSLAEPLSGLIGLFILFVGIRIAWRMTAGTVIAVLGPYKKVRQP